MKKMYVTPRIEVVKINQSVSLLSGSPTASTASGNGGFSPTISGGSCTGRSREFDWDDEWEGTFAAMKPAQIFHQYIWIINTLRAYGIEVLQPSDLRAKMRQTTAENLKRS